MTEDQVRAQARKTARPYLLVSCAVVAVESLIFLLLGVLALADIDGANALSDVGIALFLGVYGGAQLYACRRLLAWRAGARSPLVFTQLILLGLAWGLKDSDRPWLGVIMAVGAAVVLIGLLMPAVTRALSAERFV